MVPGGGQHTSIKCESEKRFQITLERGKDSWALIRAGVMLTGRPHTCERRRFCPLVWGVEFQSRTGSGEELGSAF